MFSLLASVAKGYKLVFKHRVMEAGAQQGDNILHFECKIWTFEGLWLVLALKNWVYVQGLAFICNG